MNRFIDNYQAKSKEKNSNYRPAYQTILPYKRTLVTYLVHAERFGELDSTVKPSRLSAQYRELLLGLAGDFQLDMDLALHKGQQFDWSRFVGELKEKAVLVEALQDAAEEKISKKVKFNRHFKDYIKLLESISVAQQALEINKNALHNVQLVLVLINLYESHPKEIASLNRGNVASIKKREAMLKRLNASSDSLRDEFDNSDAGHIETLRRTATLNGYSSLVDGEYDHLPEQAFYMVGSIEEALEKAKKA